MNTEDGQPEYVNTPAPSLSDANEGVEHKQRSIADIMQAASASNSAAPLVVYTGDAAGTLPPLPGPRLTEGSGVAIETGYKLARSIDEAMKRQAEEDTLKGKGGGGMKKVMSQDNMKLHLLDLETERTRRWRKMQFTSRLSRSVFLLETEV